MVYDENRTFDYIQQPNRYVEKSKTNSRVNLDDSNSLVAPSMPGVNTAGSGSNVYKGEPSLKSNRNSSSNKLVTLKDMKKDRSKMNILGSVES